MVKFVILIKHKLVLDEKLKILMWHNRKTFRKMYKLKQLFNFQSSLFYYHSTWVSTLQYIRVDGRKMIKLISEKFKNNKKSFRTIYWLSISMWVFNRKIRAANARIEKKIDKKFVELQSFSWKLVHRMKSFNFFAILLKMGKKHQDLLLPSYLRSLLAFFKWRHLQTIPLQIFM